jgi:hypothetical protein
MNRTIFTLIKRSNVNRFVAQTNKIKAANMNVKNAYTNLQEIRKQSKQNNHNKIIKRQFSHFSQFPPPEEPQHWFYMILALGVCYIITKR